MNRRASCAATPNGGGIRLFDPASLIDSSSKEAVLHEIIDALLATNTSITPSESVLQKPKARRATSAPLHLPSSSSTPVVLFATKPHRGISLPSMEMPTSNHRAVISRPRIPEELTQDAARPRTRFSLELTRSILEPKETLPPTASQRGDDAPLDLPSIERQIELDMLLKPTHTLTLRNPSTTAPLLFKMKTSTRHRHLFCLTPNQGIVPPLASVAIAVEYVPEVDAPWAPAVHTLLLQTAPLDAPITGDIPALWTACSPADVSSQRIRVNIACTDIGRTEPTTAVAFSAAAFVFSGPRATVTLSNGHGAPIAFHVKTLCARRYDVHPVAGVVPRHGTVTIEVSLTATGRKQAFMYTKSALAMQDSLRVDTVLLRDHADHERVWTLDAIQAVVAAAPAASVVLPCFFSPTLDL
ncbi:Aste57867_13019 [Aphanomyces stellatus]|uniref:Aste57867_13019 protein n=1 Tax=Aphanomyces stellatus TaxID=120398 RepID=A0A485KXR7_9STRA|nr:hypothetical protein As57867_012971 [Aphanomyces stellatus]VFT89864.1 Aste57867_13019 [Aphanomyces stellatus]